MTTRPTGRGVGCLLIAALLVVLAAVAGFSLLRGQGLADPVPSTPWRSASTVPYVCWARAYSTNAANADW